MVAHARPGVVYVLVIMEGFEVSMISTMLHLAYIIISIVTDLHVLYVNLAFILIHIVLVSWI